MIGLVTVQNLERVIIGPQQNFEAIFVMFDAITGECERRTNSPYDTSFSVHSMEQAK